MHAEATVGRSETLWGMDGGAVLTLRLEPLGQVLGYFVICPKQAGEPARLHGILDLDQTYLPEIAKQCDLLLRGNYVGD